MPGESGRRVILEKSKTVRRRYQRSNKRLTFTASQVERIERGQKREARAKKLREKEKRRIATKKERAEKEAKARQERIRLGLPDPNAPSIPSSQPLLSRFLVRPKGNSTGETNKARVELDTTTADESMSDEFDEDEEWVAEADAKGRSQDTGSEKFQSTAVMGTAKDVQEFNSNIESKANGNQSLPEAVELAPRESTDIREEDLLLTDEEDFPGCSVFCDEDVLNGAKALTSNDEASKNHSDKMAPERTEGTDKEATVSKLSVGITPSNLGSSFLDETAILLEQMVHDGADEFDTDEDFELELIQFSEQIGV